MKSGFRWSSPECDVDSPAFVYNEAALTFSCERAKALCYTAGINQFFPLKCHTLWNSLLLIAEHVDGFATSSLFEARLSREILGNVKKVHFTSPALRDDESEELLLLCDGISFNSLSQWSRLKARVSGQVTCGLRINPQLSLVKDARYDPCRLHSRLGTPLEQIKQVLASQPDLLDGIEGIHFHTNCDATDWSPLRKTVQHLDSHISDLLHQCEWINLGGGYLLNDDTDPSAFFEIVQLLRDKYELEVIIEPGASVIRDACFLVAHVVDLFDSDGKQVAILDTTVNHMPEVFEYQFSPDVVGDSDDGRYSYILAGSTCLAGDVFGEYAFDTPLEVGTRVTFPGVGAYTLVKSHMFNGVNLPSIYALNSAGKLTLQRRYDYEDFRRKWEPKQYDDESLRDILNNSHGIGQRKPASKVRP